MPKPSPITINGEPIPEEAIVHETGRFLTLPGLRAIEDEAERNLRARAGAEDAIIDRVLVRQIAERDTRPIPRSEIDQEVARQTQQSGCRGTADANVRIAAEQHLRLLRTMQDLAGPVPPPREEEIAAFYQANRTQFAAPDKVTAAHIVVHINESQNEPQAQERINQAQAALDAGEPFDAVVERYSDCKGNGGKLDPFTRGVMVEEFEKVVFEELRPGQRSGVFRTPFGFHIAEVLERNEGECAPLDIVRPDLEKYFNARAQGLALHGALQMLRAKSVITRPSQSRSATA